MHDPLVFETIDLVEVPVTIGAKKFVLREPTADTASRFRSAAARCMKMSGDNLSSIDGIGGIEPLLVSLCLFEVDAEGFRQAVPLGTIMTWPSKVIKPLFALAKQLGDLDEKKVTDAKNSQPATTAGSA